MNPFKSLMRLLSDSTVNQIEVSAAPPFAKLIFDKTELLAMLQGQDRVSDVVAKCFVRRRVFWEDITKENRDAVVKSLEEVESQLDQLSEKLSSGSDRAVLGLGRFVRAWATATSLVRKQLADRLREIDEEKASILGYESAGEDRDGALQEALTALRQRIYPLVTLLVAFLSDDDPTKHETQDLLDRGLDLVPSAKLQRGCMPDVDAAA